MMNAYSNIEKQSIIRILYDMMMVDGDCDHSESQYLMYIKKMLGLSSFSTDSPVEQQCALSVINNMDDDKKMEIMAMLHQMIMADGIQDKSEMYFLGQIVSSTGIDKVLERKTAGMNIQYNDAQIYCDSSKFALQRRSTEFLRMIESQAESFREYFTFNSYTLDEKCQMIVEHSKASVRESGWDLNDVDGASWFIGNFTDAMVKAGAVANYDEVFKKCFGIYFRSI